LEQPLIYFDALQNQELSCILSEAFDSQETFMLNKLTPNLMVEDVARTLAFYVDVLGFETVMTLPETAPFGFAIVRRDQVELMFQSRQSLSENVPALTGAPIGASQTFYIEVTGLRELYESLRGKVETVVDLHTTFYGTQEFYFRDLNGYILSFSEAGR
jgi:catechol 2,3-dioxygenase-like lactoylglutathione lyase family enzyme